MPPRRRALWKRVLRGIAAAIGILIILLAIGIVVLLHNASFHNYVLRTVQQRASAALGSEVQLQNYKLTWSGISPTVDMYGLVVHGAAPYPDPPMLVVDHARIGVTITSLVRRSYYLNDVTLDHPVVRVFVDQHGTDNLPQTKSNSQQKSNTSIFDLGVRHALLDKGEIYYNNRKSVLDADLHDLTIQTAFDPGQKKYTGTLAYRDGHLKMETFNPIPHDMEAKFWVTPQTFTLERAALHSGGSQFIVTATVNDFANPKADATYEATLNTGELRSIMKNPTLPVGIIRADGKLNYVSKPDTPMLDTLTLNGNMSSAALTVQTPSLQTQVRNIGAQYSLEKGNVDVRNIHANLLGGVLNGTMTMRDITGDSHSKLHATLKGVDLGTLKQMGASGSLNRVSLTGGMNATADASWGKTFNDMVAKVDTTLNAHMAPANGGNAIPLDGVIHARYAAANQQVTLDQSYLRTPKTSIDVNGTVSNRSTLQVRLNSGDLHELETLADMVQPPKPGQEPLGLYGAASFNGAVRGTTSAPELTGQLTAENLRLKGSAWKSVRTNVDVSSSVASLQNAELVPSDGGRINLSARAPLRKWQLDKAGPLQVRMNASQVNVADLTKLAGSSAPVSGTLGANVTLNGSVDNPVGNGTVKLTSAKVYGQPLQSANINFNGTGNEVHANLAVQIPNAGNANGTLTYFPKQQGYDAMLQATGINLGQLKAVKDRGLDLKGTLNLTAQGKGTVQNPQLQAVAEIPRLDLHGQTLSGLKLQAGVANHVATYNLDSQVVQTSVRSHGTVNLAGDYNTDAVLDTQTIPFEPLVAAFAPSLAGAVTGQTELHATVRGPLKKQELMEAHVNIPQLAVNYKNTVHLAEASPIRADYVNGVLTIPQGAIRGTDTDIQFQGRVPVTDKTAPASLLLRGTVGLQIAQLFDPDITSAGQLRFDINSFGQRGNPDVQGQIRIENASFASGGMPLGMQNGNGILTLTKNRLDITQFQATMGGGTVRASGGVLYRPSLKYDLALAGNGIRMLYPEGARTGVGMNIAMTGTTDSGLVHGTVRIEQLSFTPDFDLSNFMGQFGGGAATPPPTGGLMDNLKLDVGVQTTNGLNLVSRQLSLQGTANLRVTGTAAAPVILGRVNLGGGDLIFNGNRYVLQGGTIDFVNPSETQPVLNVGVNTTIQQYNIQMRFWGPADHLHTTYASDPALPPVDIINLIAFGKTTEAASANPNPPGMLGAESKVASTVSSQATSRIAKAAGISQLSIDPVLGGNGQNPGARFAIQQRVTSKIFVDFSTDVTSTQNQVIKLEYHHTPKVSINGSRDQNGGFGVDARIKKNW